MNEIKKDWTTEDVKQLRDVFMTNNSYKILNNMLWKQAFEFHNSIVPTKQKLGMGCRPCFIKVLYFIEDQINNK